ncbi:type II toxin-antitoxin system PemK/MazF family toxin [Aliarcobacter butzleri]|uniref:type II toxin-antitoxin system PemK/MazF family toxin n=1 Tax=Aliarcobacter butzleri TaxID=28197 RepID=UPI000DB48553|nr:type II toxin-antitoxin system PemK/MazF family toxin [Aliarcobacter butzleri]MCT7592396.1 type II toxin-antitoxin system PemK/MazF family toxin [Aliarcobacter butzleri]MDN5062080.1 type II toxin-antitoxin system PemK/MazF family toxin [Aliarcobacter butzleri]PZQ04150.1 MAG: hypothetical protein DI567_11540 [Aliarcobacter butzleri]
MSSVRWADLHRWSLVWVEYGTPKKDILAIDNLDCVDCNSKYKHGVNHDNEFSYLHMGIVISKNITNSSITILPLTETKIGDLENISRVVLLKNDYGFINKDTTILIDNITTIEKKKRVVGIKLKWIPSPLRRKIQRAMLSSFK